MKKKDPVLWVVVDKEGKSQRFLGWPSHARADDEAELLNRLWPPLAPFRVVKYVPAPKKRKKA